MKGVSTEKLHSKTNVGKQSKTHITSRTHITTACDLPFDEWSDKEIREENWEDFEWMLAKHVHSHESRSSSKHQEQFTKGPKYFRDQQTVTLPYSIPVHKWTKVNDIFPFAHMVVQINNEGYPDLISGSKHILHSVFMRSFISSIHTLIYLGKTTKFRIEYTSPNFVPTTDGSPWKPWHHIYSNSTAGKATINKSGKYVVRLYWLGAWRKIYVDDRIPVDSMNNVLLPSVIKPNKESKDSSTSFCQADAVEIWPYLLSKALLKIASLTYYEDREMIDFDIIQCLTGWVPQKINTEGLSTCDIWRICWAYTNHYTSPSSSSTSTRKKSVKDADSEKDTEEFITPQQGKEDKEEGNEKHKKRSESDIVKEHKTEERDVGEDNKTNNQGPITNEETSHFVVASCNDLSDLNANDEVPNFSPCLSHEFLIVQTKDVPLKSTFLTEDMKNWKRVRWLAWAAKKGILSNEQLQPQNYKVVSAFKKTLENNVCHQYINKIEFPPTNNSISRKNKNSVKSNDIILNRERMSSTGANIKYSIDLAQTLTDSSDWIDQEKLSQQINKITIYFQPSEFNNKIMISNLYTDRVPYDGDWAILQQPLDLQKYNNEPIYIFSESIDSQLLLINLSQTGYTDMLQYDKNVEESKSCVSQISSECEFCLAAFVKRLKEEESNVNNNEVTKIVRSSKIEQKLFKHHRSCCHIVLENYDWQTETLGDTVTSLNTYGSRSTILHFEPGRKIFKLWLKSDTSYVAYIFSDDDIVIGDLETILLCMADESQLLDNMCAQIGDNFLSLIHAFGMPSFPEKLKAFYNSYKPTQSLTKAESTVLHDTFFDLLSELVEVTLSTAEIYALKVLFLKWQNHPRLEYPEGFNVCNCFDDDDLEYLKSLERNVIKIQALFRGMHERSLMLYHDPSHADHLDILDRLLNIYSKIFSTDNRYTVCSNLVRAFLAHPDMNTLKRKYELCRELDNVLVVRETTHNMKATQSQWTLICRQSFSVKPSSNPILVKIDLFCNINQYVVRVVDNDTNIEMKRYINNVAVNEYKPNVNGYTVLCYAWSPSSKQIQCRLSLATKRVIDYEILIIPKVSTELNSFHGMYTPNLNNTVCKYLVQVRSQRAVLSLRFGSSYADAILNFKLYDDKGKILKEITGKGNVVLPAISLDYKEKFDIDLFVPSQKSLRKVSSTTHRSHHRSSHIHGHNYYFPDYYQHSEHESYHAHGSKHGLNFTGSQHSIHSLHSHHKESHHGSQHSIHSLHSHHHGSQYSIHSLHPHYKEPHHGSQHSIHSLHSHHKEPHHGSHHGSQQSIHSLHSHHKEPHHGSHYGSQHSIYSLHSLYKEPEHGPHHGSYGNIKSHHSQHSISSHGSNSSHHMHGHHLHRPHDHNQEAPYFHALHHMRSETDGPHLFHDHHAHDHRGYDHHGYNHSGHNPWKNQSNLRFSTTSLTSNSSYYHSLPSSPHIIANEKSVKPHELPFYYHNKIEFKRNIRISHPVEYAIEVSVVDDSWPLTAEEWRNLETSTPDGKFSTFGSTVRDVANRFRLSTKAKKSTTGLKTDKKSRTSLKSSQKGMLSSKKLPRITSNMSIIKQHQLSLENPHWIMQCVVNHGELVDITKNVKREAKWKEIKSKWAERDADRAKRARELRRNFLRINMITNPRGPYNEWSSVRSLVKDEIAAYVLPPLDLTSYMIKDPQKVDEDNRKLKKSVDFKRDNRREAALINEDEEIHKKRHEKLENLAKQQAVNFNIVNKWFNRIRRESYAMMEDAMNLRNLVHRELMSKGSTQNKRKRKQPDL